MIKQTIEKLIKDALVSVGADNSVAFGIEHPADLSHGDYSTNVAMVTAKILKISPRELADKLVSSMNSNKPADIDRIEIAGPGFINFHLTSEFFRKGIIEVANSGIDYITGNSLAGKNVLVEYTDPNPFKVFHIGHLMSNSVGESIARIIEKGGANIVRANYQGDVGLHVAKAMWGMLKTIDNKPADNSTISAKTAFIGEAYVLGSDSFEKDDNAKKEIADLNKKIFDKSDKNLNNLYDWGREVSLAHFEEIYTKLGTKFNNYFFESEVAETGLKLVKDGLEKAIFEKSDGAIIFKGEEYGLHTRVFINSQGLPTYETKELGLNKIKFEKVNPDLSIIITASEQSDYFRVLMKVMSLIIPDVASKTKHVSHGMLRFASGKMSSRKGNIITGESLISDMEEIVSEKIKDRGFNGDEQIKIATEVAVGAIKYSILKQSTGSDIIYDFEKSISFDGDSGPYLQYSCVRASSVISKALEENIRPASDFSSAGIAKTSVLEKIICRFPEVVKRAEESLEPHIITTYLTELAGAFNSYYGNNQIVVAGDNESSYRVALTKAFRDIMIDGLWLLGINVPNKM